MTAQRNDTPSTPPPPTMPCSGVATGAEGIVTALLKAPNLVADTIAIQQKGLLWAALTLLVVAVACHAVFGVAIGLFAGWPVAAMDVVKAPLALHRASHSLVDSDSSGNKKETGRGCAEPLNLVYLHVPPKALILIVCAGHGT